MKKRLMLLLLVFSAIVFADVPYDSVYPEVNTSNDTKIPRYQDFPLDNIHILRLQEASMSLGRNVSVINEQLANYQQQQSSQISGMQVSIDSLERNLQVRVDDLQNTLNQFKNVKEPESSKTPFTFLFISNLLLFVVVIILVVLIHKKPLPEDHLIAPPELVSFIRTSHKNHHELRLELLKKGWTPEVVENALKVVRR